MGTSCPNLKSICKNFAKNLQKNVTTKSAKFLHFRPGEESMSPTKSKKGPFFSI